MRIIEKVIEDQIISSGATGTDKHMAEVDLSSHLRTTREMNVVLKTKTGASAPGTGKTVTANLYWADRGPYTLSNVQTILANRKESAASPALNNSAEQEEEFELFTTKRLKSGLLYVSIDHDNFDNDITIVGLMLVRVPSVNAESPWI